MTFLHPEPVVTDVRGAIIRPGRSVLSSGEASIPLKVRKNEKQISYLQTLNPKIGYSAETGVDLDLGLVRKSREALQSSGIHGMPQQGEVTPFLRSKREATNGQQGHRLAKRFNEFVGKRTGGSASFDNGLDDGLSWKGSPQGVLMSGLENGLAKAKFGSGWRNAGGSLRPLTLQRPDDIVMKDFGHRLGEMLQARSSSLWGEDSNEDAGAWLEEDAQSKLNVSPLVDSHLSPAVPQQATAALDAEFPSKRWAEFPGKRSMVLIPTASKRYAEFLGKRSIAAAQGAITAALDTDMLRTRLSQILAHEP